MLQQHRAYLFEYWQMAKKTFLGEAPKLLQMMNFANVQDLPGWDASFDAVNLHFHGMQIVPHLFYPQGTGNSSAPWIETKPDSGDSGDRQCFCYVFDVPKDHPQGTFFWHVHRHGAVSMQGWQGMLGFMHVGDKTFPGSHDYELAAQGVNRTIPMALWEWQVDPANTISRDPSTFMEGNFLGDQQKIFMTNNHYQPTFHACINETIHVRL